MTCELGNKKFAVSVADVLLYDTSCAGEQLILNGKTLINSSITQAIQQTTVYGGKGSQSQFEFNYQKEITVNIEDSTFSPVYMAVQNGTNIVSEEANFYVQEKVTFDATGKATLKSEPVGTVQVGDEFGTYQVVIPTGSEITMEEMADKEATVVYVEKGEFRKMEIKADAFPKTLKLVMTVDIFDDRGKVEEMQIVIPRFKPDGAIDLSLTHDGVATSTLAGKALADCNANYAEIVWKDLVGENEVCYTALAVTPSSIEFETGDTETLKVKGIRGGLYGNIAITEGLEFTSADDTVATVDAVTGLVTAVGVGTTTITITEKSGQTRTIPVEVTV